MKTVFEEQLEKEQDKQKDLEKTSQTYSTIRFLVFVGILAGIYFGYTQALFYYAMSVILLVLFLYLVKKHDGIKYQLAYCKMKQEVLNRYLDRFTNEWKKFSDEGQEFLSEHFPPGYDLDIFGNASLYQYINTASTHVGREQLANWLSLKPKDEKEITKRQNAVKELLEKLEFTIHFEVLGRIANSKVNSKKVFESIEEMNEDSYSIPMVMKVLKWLLPCATIVSLIVAYITGSNVALTIMEAGIVLQLLLTFVFAGKITSTLRPVFALHESLSIYLKMFESLKEETFESEYLKEQLTAMSESISGIKALSFVSELSKVRFNFLAHLLMSALLSWDFHCVEQLNKWKKDYLSILPKWFNVIGNVEALSSLSILAKVKEVYCFPTISSEVEVKTSSMGHPLLLEETTVFNDFSSDDTSCVITGSNMSGKTTFLRTLGLNTILTYSGAPVHAQAYQMGIMDIFTSMRIEDNVSEGISTFYAEILRIKQMVDFHETKKPMLALIDEIFKGTNSRDRIMGATETIRQLSNEQCITCVTTHDYELCDLESDPEIKSKNYHFSEYYENNKIYFDYKIKPGRATTTNAEYLLKMVGIIKDKSTS
ncbi:MutS-related protein [Breznakia pachnodae]|uniref:DNA mismatch repair ATPase MutS n=1 Tax=Breznakia pachnodae TaxID=265178 RepID=A0ABU0DYE6_9FIRM|nr:hypothetical protein [Breznakia pachnodae]MDQ0359513.1 DNA mismatch repair ATPase MutS [Breznakia pachnodae]